MLSLLNATAKWLSEAVNSRLHHHAWESRIRGRHLCTSYAPSSSPMQLSEKLAAHNLCARAIDPELWLSNESASPRMLTIHPPETSNPRAWTSGFPDVAYPHFPRQHAYYLRSVNHSDW